MAGTPAYLAPEQHAGADPSEASDWYAVGVTLYEALTGRLPFDGSWHELGSRKRHGDPPPPASIESQVPDDLNEICMGLLCRDPERRLSGRDALDTLVDRGTLPPETRRREPRRPKPCFVGRARQLAILTASFAAVSEGRAAAVCIHGPSGIGKTALVQQFLDQVPGDDAVVLRGRCYEHESVPYKALDGVIDSLSQHLGRLRRTEAETLVPSDVLALSRLFPVMLHVESVATAPRLRAGDPGSARPAAPRILVVARAADPNGESPAAGPLHRRSALGGCGQRAPARGVTPAARAAIAPDGRVLPHGRNRVQAVSSEAARTRRVEQLHGSAARAP